MTPERELLREARDELRWCSGSPDFNEGGQARKGWITGPQAVLNKIDAFFAQPENSQQVGIVQVLPLGRTPETDAIDATADQNYGTDMYSDMLGHARRKEREVAYWKHEFYRVEKMVESEQDRVEELERQLAAAKEAIEDAPHAEYCGAPSSSGAEVYECRCWKAEALSKLGADKGEQE